MSRIAPYNPTQSAIAVELASGAPVVTDRTSTRPPFIQVLERMYDLSAAEAMLVSGSASMRTVREAYDHGAEVHFPPRIEVPDPVARMASGPTSGGPAIDAPLFPSSLPAARTTRAPMLPAGVAPAGEAFNAAPADVRTAAYRIAQAYCQAQHIPFTVRLSPAQTAELRALLVADDAVGRYVDRHPRVAENFIAGCAAIGRTAPETFSVTLPAFNTDTLLPALSQMDVFGTTDHDTSRCVPSSILGAALQQGWPATQRLLRAVLADSDASRMSADERTFLGSLAERTTGTLAVGELHVVQELMFEVLAGREHSEGLVFDPDMLASLGFHVRGELLRCQDDVPHDLPAHPPEIASLNDGDTLFLGGHPNGGGGHAYTITRHGDSYLIYDTGQNMRPPTRTVSSLDEAWAAVAEPTPQGLACRDWTRALVVSR